MFIHYKTINFIFIFTNKTYIYIVITSVFIQNTYRIASKWA